MTKDDLNYQLLRASYYGYTDSIIYWLNRGADVNAVSTDGITALNYAIQSKNLHAVKALVINGANVNYYTSDNLPAIFLAVSYNEKEIVKFLISKDARIDAVVKNRLNLLHYAARYADSSVFRTIYQLKPELLELKDDDGNTPFMFAAYYKRYDLLPIICNKYHSEKHRDNYGLTPFLLSIIQIDTIMAEQLLKCGAQLNEVSYNGYGFVEYAIISKNKNLLQWALTKKTTSNNPHFLVKLSYVSENRHLARVFRSAGYPNYNGFVFTSLNIGPSHVITSNDYMFGLSTRLVEYRYGFQFMLNFHTRLWPNRILFPADEHNVLIQAWERRSIWDMQALKHIRIAGHHQQKLYIMAGYATYYTYGRYRAFEQRPRSYWLQGPSGYLLWQTPSISLALGFEYFKFKNHDAKGLHVTFKHTFTIPLQNLYVPKKQISW